VVVERFPRVQFLVPAVLAATLAVSGCNGSDVRDKPAAGTTPTAAEISSTTAANGNHVAIPRTRVLLRVPDGMVVDPALPGLARAQSHTSVVVIEYPLAGATAAQVLDQMAAGFSGDQAAAKGLQMGTVEHSSVAGFPALTATGTQQAAGLRVGKAIVTFVAEDAVVILTGNVEPGDVLSPSDLLAVLVDARWSHTPAAGDLGIDITPTAGFQRQPGTSSITLTLGGATGSGVPKFLAAPSLGKSGVAPDQRRAFAEARFRELPYKATLDTTTEVHIAGLPGFELLGRASDGRTVYAVLMFATDRYIIMTGDFDSARYPDLLPAFRTMANSLVVR
jgi:hypothetical protein